ncbi:SseB family protein [Ornithinicoccus halotolerans]|uniref:SseB family protein n=1 Tax=Ornithinicoccus halotolerans TaxID=1748220 RepID=UPI00129644AF|nr:SseB family protein [Ornithinicoccus halotolerans]
MTDPGGRFAGHDPRQGADTAGTPWRGRTLQSTGFDDDTGQADPALLAALDHPEAETALVAAVARARLLVPVVAVAGEQVATEAGPPADAGGDMAAVTLSAPDGTRALPVFSSLAALRAWDPQARPVPVPAWRAAQAALQEECTVLLLDLPAAQGSPSATLRESMVRALAEDRPWRPAHQDDHVQRAVADAVASEPAVAGHALDAGPGGALRITLALVPGLQRAARQQVVQRVGERLAADVEARARLDAVTVALRRTD